MTVLICGGRGYHDYERFCQVLCGFDITLVVHGGANGADAFAERWANENRVAVRSYPPDWKRWGKAAGPIRNGQMLQLEQPRIVIAFPGGRGTADMVKKAKAAGVPVIQVDTGNPMKDAGLGVVDTRDGDQHD